MVQLHKYSGAGNDFVVLDGRTEDVSAYRSPEKIAELCDRTAGFRAADGRIGADGLMILTDGPDCDFRMEYYNSDGSGGMMCGNGGRCIVAFADALGLQPADGRVFRFVAADGEHTGEILAREGGCKTVRIRMIDVQDFHPALDGWFLDTGTRHFVRFVPDVEAVDVEEEGRRARWDPVFAPIGANANFVSVDPDGTLRVRTFEKGVEGETLACGTGITASAIAAFLASPRAAGNYFSDRFAEKPISAPPSTTPTHAPSFADVTGESPMRYSIQARIARLGVEFVPGDGCFTDVYLTGPAEEILRDV
ncbi:MAG: diaminopimelate epimerase [Bacteroidales bacterium]|jgi:diaminopimelate epimerase|nr:diaminopimelate epimerase [Bacteroidales bacterium]